MTDQTESIAKLAGALCKAQAKITGAVKDSNNPFFKSKYADLAAVMDAIRVPFAESELCYVQTTEVEDTGVTVVTTLMHSSGEWMRGKLKMMPKDATPQGIGSCITYARRYALAAIAGVAQVDDDANAASGRGNDPRGEQPPVDEKQISVYVDKFNKAFDADVEEVAKAKLVFDVHSEICSSEALYIAVADKLGSTKKRAIREYVAQYNKAVTQARGMTNSGRQAA